AFRRHGPPQSIRTKDSCMKWMVALLGLVALSSGCYNPYRPYGYGTQYAAPVYPSTTTYTPGPVYQAAPVYQQPAVVQPPPVVQPAPVVQPQTSTYAPSSYVQPAAYQQCCVPSTCGCN